MESKKTTVVDEELDGLDDILDEVLDDFSSSSTSKNQTSSNKPSTSSSSEQIPSSKLPSSNDEIDPLSQIDEEYVAQLAADMEDFVKRLEEDDELRRAFQGFMGSTDVENQNEVNNNNKDRSTGSTGIKNNNNNNNNNINSNIDNINNLINNLNINGKPNGSPSKEGSSSSFQDKINQTLNKLQNSSNKLDAEISAEEMDDMLGGDMDQVLEWMMESLTTKECLYEPMKEFGQKYPKWLEENKGKVPISDYHRYEKQSEYIQKIIEKYEAPNFDENSEQQNKEIVNLMQELQDFGQPPAEILSELAPGVELDEQGMPKLSAADLSACKTM